jgi:hypothetical protein
MTIMDDYLNQIRKQLRHLELSERDQVLAEVRGHLTDEVARLRKADKSLSRDEAELKATHAFGEPEELGVAYGPRGGVIRKRTGERLLEVAVLTGRAAGRGVKGTLKWTGIAAAVLLGAGLIVFISLLFFASDIAETFQDDIRESIPREVYSYSGSWAVPNSNNGVVTDSFQIGEHVKEFEFHASTTPETGCLAIQLQSPSGQVMDINGNGCQPTDRDTTYTESGTWQIRYTFIAYTGSVSVDAYAYEKARA